MHIGIKKAFGDKEITLNGAFGLEPPAGKRFYPNITKSELVDAGVAPGRVDRVYDKLCQWAEKNPDQNHKAILAQVGLGIDGVL